MELQDGRPDFLVTGIGINLFPPAGGFPKEIQLKAGALFDDKIYTLAEERRNIKNDIAVRIIDNVLKYSKLKPIPDILSKYRERSFITNRYVRIVGGKQALVLGIGDGFELLVRYDDGRCEGLLAGEVSLELENYEKSEQRTDKNGE